MIFEELDKAIESRDIDKILNLITKIPKEDYNKLINVIEPFYKKELTINKTIYNLNLFYYNRTVKKRTPRHGCYEYLYVNEGKTKYRPQMNNKKGEE
jgi:hypothetical protein